MEKITKIAFMSKIDKNGFKKYIISNADIAIIMDKKYHHHRQHC
jgi:hypothetical protein